MMPTSRDAGSSEDIFTIKAEEYFDRFGRTFTWRSKSTTEDEDGKVTNVTISTTTIKGDLQYNDIPKFYDRYGISPEGDGMFFTLSRYNVQVNDEIVDPADSTVKWKLTKIIETEDVGTGKPYVGFITEKAP